MNRKLLCRILFVLIGCFALSVCTVNINDSNANQNANRNVNLTTVSSPSPVNAPTAARASWTVVVCSSRWSEVTLQAGPTEADSRTFATWRASGNQKIYELPARVQNLTEIYFQAISSETEKPVELCVLYDGRPKKRVAFDEGSENHTVGASDDDDNDCRCTQ